MEALAAVIVLACVIGVIMCFGAVIGILYIECQMRSKKKVKLLDGVYYDLVESKGEIGEK